MKQIILNLEEEQFALDYKILGEGKPLLFLHGAGTNFEYYTDFLKFLSKNYKVYTFTLPGFGNSSSIKSEYSVDLLTTLVHEFILKMQITGCAICGHSLGGGLTSLYYEKYGKEDKIKALLLLAPLVYTIDKKIIDLSKNLIHERYLEKEYLPSTNLSMKYYLRASSKVKSMLKQYKFVKELKFENILERIDVPVLAVIGKEDLVLDSEKQLIGLKKISNCKIMEFDNYGHNVAFGNKEAVLKEFQKIY